MKIKQQKQIKAFLVEEFGNDRGSTLFGMQEEILNALIKNTANKSKNQMKTLVQTILPRIALYKALSKEDYPEADVYAYLRKYMLDIVAAKKHASTAKMEIVPGFYSIYSSIFLKIMRTTDLQESVQSHGKDYFDVTIKKCLWHTACVENGCEELCRLFCDVDNVTYGGLKKIGFTRTKTLGYGGDCCDFHFFRNFVSGKRNKRDRQAVENTFMRKGENRIRKEDEESNSFYEWRYTNKYRGKQFSILGDSISTLYGYNPDGYKVFYYGDNCRRANVEECADTWWGNVLSFFGAELLVNNSWSGSRVTKFPDQEEVFPAGCSDERTSSLHINSVKPDVIIVYLGTNDWAFGARTGEEKELLTDVESEIFAKAYEAMLRKMKGNYPDSEIWCCTLSETFMSNNPDFHFPHRYAGIDIEVYNEIIRRTVRAEECRLIDMYNMKMPYDSIDGTHPDRQGMKTIAASVCYAMADLNGRGFLNLDEKESPK